jgi:hypothetical protein
MTSLILTENQEVDNLCHVLMTLLLFPYFCTTYFLFIFGTSKNVKMNITHLGEALFTSPITRIINDDLRVPEHIVHHVDSTINTSLQFELAGPRGNYFSIRQKHAPEL